MSASSARWKITTPTFLIEGEEMGNADSVDALHAAPGSAPIRKVLVPGLDHFSVLAPGTEVVAAAILADEGAGPDLRIDEAAILAR